MREPFKSDSSSALTRVSRYDILLDLRDEGFVSLMVAKVRGPNAGPRIVELSRVERTLARAIEVKEAFLAEARAAGRVRHPNFVHPVDTLSHEGDLFGATEFALGTRLDELRQAAAAERYELPLAVSLRILLDVLLGLSALHATGANTAGSRTMVHGDVAPTNVFITSRGEAKIVHSGLSSVTSRAGVIAARNHRLAYKAPEQLRAGVNAVPISPAADVFAVGVLLWEALQGARLFAHATDVEVAEHILYGQIPALEPGGSRYMPIALLPLVANALERNPDIRTPNAAMLAEAIERAPGVHLATAAEVAQVVDELMGPAIERRLARVEELVERSNEGAKSEGSLRPVIGHRSMKTPVGYVYPPPSSSPSSAPGSGPRTPSSVPPGRAVGSPGYDVSTRPSYRTPADSRIVAPRVSRTFPPSSRTPSSSRSLGPRSTGSAKLRGSWSSGGWPYYLAIGAIGGVLVFSILRVVMGAVSSFGGAGSETAVNPPNPGGFPSVATKGNPGGRVAANPPPEANLATPPVDNSAAAKGDLAEATGSANPDTGPRLKVDDSSLAPSAKPTRVPTKAPGKSNIPPRI
jgi:hypothetical protein